ncbi:group I intron endonuclease [uncultured Clostridium sp.]|nr:group I intron endonuclease [uncultured Clostridium sp.]
MLKSILILFCFEEKEMVLIECAIVPYEERIWKVYVHINKINGKKYFGITSLSLKARSGNNGKRYTRNKTYFANAINKYGWDAFYHILLLDNLIKSEACIYEIMFIKVFDTTNRDKGYNMTGGGEGSLGYRHPDEILAKLSFHSKRENLSPETRKKLSDSHRKENLSPETRRKLSLATSGKNNPMYGKKMTEEARRKMSENSTHKKPVLCLNSMETFPQVKIPAKELGIHPKAITNCCRGKAKSSGVHPVTHEKLYWIYCENYEKLGEAAKESLREKFYTGSLLASVFDFEKEAV